MPTVLITGASSGIGEATATRFVEEGWNVIATMRTPAGDSTETKLIARLDVQDAATVSSAIAAGLERFGGIDVVVNNAGYGQYGMFEAVSAESVQAEFDVNVFGLMRVMRAVLPHMRARRRGLIINVSSGAGLYGLPMASVYCASKFAVEGFTEAVSYELAPLGITAKLVIPHGGVSGTAFPGRGGAEDPASIPDYDPVAAQLSAAMANLAAPSMTAVETVAATVFESAIDGTDRLRYLVGADTRGFIAAWDTRSNDDYLAFMRAQFGA
jgi:NAD(P)-dependent dehydrogenase (short-subunit alcohol dehydrogenase family)